MGFFHDSDYNGYFYSPNGLDVMYVSDKDVEACKGSISKAIAKYGRPKTVIAPSRYHLLRLATLK